MQPHDATRRNLSRGRQVTRLYAIRSNTLARIEAEPGTGRGAVGKHCVTGGDLHPGSLVVVGVAWHESEADAWMAEARRLDVLADRRAVEARRLCVEVEALVGQAQGAMRRAREATRAGDGHG